MDPTPTRRIAIHGASGRMGCRLVALTLEDDRLELVAAIDRAGHPRLGQDAGKIAQVAEAGVLLSDRLAVQADVLIDFSTSAATRLALAACVRARCAMVIGTTGLSGQDHTAIDAAGQQVAILQAPNMSLGVNLMFQMAGQLARQLGDDYDIEITEAHHRYKVDAPSGTALGIAEAICAATGKDLAGNLVYDRHGADAARKPGQIGMHALRLGDVVGRHTACFATLGEELQLTHVATTRDVFARGALKAAKWLAGRPSGRYCMADLLAQLREPANP